MSNSLRYWNDQGREGWTSGNSVSVPSNVEVREIKNLGKTLAYFQSMPYDTEKQYSASNYNRRMNKYYLIDKKNRVWWNHANFHVSWHGI